MLEKIRGIFETSKKMSWKLYKQRTSKYHIQHRVFNLPTEHNYVLVLTNFTVNGEFHSLKQTVVCRLATSDF